MSKIKYELDTMSNEEVKSLAADLSENNEYITETAGFIPLEVKLKQFEQNGLIAQFQVSDFDSNDYRDLFLNPDYMVNPEDDLEDIQEKLNLRNLRMKEIQESKAEKKAEAGTQEPEKAAKAANEAAEAAD